MTASQRRARVAFMGTPDFAASCFEALANHPSVDLVAAICQPDKIHGRHTTPQPPPVKVAALARGVPVFQPTKLRSGDFPTAFAALELDLCVVAAYGRILPQALLDTPRLGCLNVHASLLPRWRGAAPIQWSIAAGDAMTGVSLMQMDAGLDTGAVLARAFTAISPDETGATLHDRLALDGARLLTGELDAIIAGARPAEPQDQARATIAPMLSRADGALDPSRPAAELERRLRAFSPWPGAFLHLDGQVLKVFPQASVVTVAHAPGRVLVDGDSLVFTTVDGGLRVREVQLEGRKRMSVQDFLRGRKIDDSTAFGPISSPAT